MVLIELLDRFDCLHAIVGDIGLERKLLQHGFYAQDVEAIVIDD